MGKKGNKRKTRWRVLPIGGDDGGACSGNEDDGDMEHDPASPGSNGSYARAANGGHQQRLLRGLKGRPTHQHARHRPFYQHDNGQPLVATEKKTFNEEEYTKITTPRQDVLFKKGYLGRKRPTPAPETTAPAAAADADVTNGNLRPDGSVVQNGEPLDNDQGYEVIAPDEQPQIIYTNGYVDQSGIYYINGGYELYDPYSGGVTVVVGPAPHFPGPGGGPPVLAAVPCQPLPLQPLEWFNPAFVPFVPAPVPPLHDPNKRFSIDSQNCSGQSSESTGPPGSPQECEDGAEQQQQQPPPPMPAAYRPQGHAAPAPPPAYVYPGYMFGPPVYNMNGVTVQGAPPQPPPGDAAAASKRRKKKRRRRRRRGGAEDGSEESSSEEKELEEPMSITSQESSSQELESDSKQSPTAEQDVVISTPQDANVLPLQADQEKTIFVCTTENTDIQSVALQQGPVKTDCERQEWRIGSGDTPLVNGVLHSDSSDTSCKADVSEKASTVLPQLPSPQTPPLPLPPPPPPPSPSSTPTPVPSCTSAATTQESLLAVEINGYGSDSITERAASKTPPLESNPTKAYSPSHTETLNNATNKIKSGKPLQDQKKKQENKKSNVKNVCNGNINVKQPGGKIRKEHKQRNIQNGYIPNLNSKMDGNESLGRSRDAADKISRTKVGNPPSCLQQKPLSSNGNTLALKMEEDTPQLMQQKSTAEKTDKNQPPNKPIRKDLCKTAKSPSASLHSDFSKCIQTIAVSECLHDATSANKSVTDHKGMGKTSRWDVSKESSGISPCPVKQPGTKHTTEKKEHESKELRLVECRSMAQVEDKNMSSAYHINFTSAINVSSTADEKEAEPPPIPPPRRKRWRTSMRRQSLERAPTPGRELEVSTDIPECVSDESSLSSSTQSEESVIELLSSMPTSPDVEAKTRSSEEDDLIYVRKPLEKIENPEIIQTAVFEEESSRTLMYAAEIEKFSHTLSQTIIAKAVEDAALECSKNTRPITHAVTRWLRSQSPEVLSLPSREHSESEPDDTDISGESTEDIADVRQEIRTGPKNVHRNPLPASSLKISNEPKHFDGFDGVGRRVAKKSGYQTNLEIKTVKEMNKKNKVSVSGGCREVCNKLSESIEQNKLPKNYMHTDNICKVQTHVVATDERFSSDSSECEGEWDLWECRVMKPSPSITPSNKDELRLLTESPDDRCITMCDPTLSVAKYYSLGATVRNTVTPEKSTTLSESSSEEEADALYHLKINIHGAESRYPVLTQELACSYKPLPKHWAIDPVMVISEKLDGSAFEKKYPPDSGVQSEESGDELAIGSNAQQINLKANISRHQSAVLMSHLQGDGPFPCGGICCILQ